ncbi:helix-turn-helix transcriptional regulator [Bacillus sp. JJ1122]|uniref:helix-turn-helix domain-containing protein n=1 Tax=Bacillus sp. JJ1122 TaxID=3122951 RepID=UPI002FFE3B13
MGQRLPYKQEITYPMIRYIRLARNCTQEKFGRISGIDQSVIAKLEKGELDLTPIYESRIRQAIRSLRISNHEIDAIRKLIEMKEIRGYKA